MKLPLIAHPLFVSTLAFTMLACAASTEEEAAQDTEQPIVGGLESTPGAWPGTVALYKNGIQACGGALVAPSWVLTAGHCVTAGSTTGGFQKVVINRHKLSTTAGETITPKRVIRHPSYTSTPDNDLALIELTTPSTAPLAKIGGADQQSLLTSGTNVVTVGWGRLSETGSTSDVLREVAVPIIANTTCKASSGYSRVSGNMICAGYPQGGRDSCQGDSGSPLFIKQGTQIFQVGLTSWGIGCARAGQPGVYTRIGNYLDWIKTTSGNAIAIGGAGTTPTTPVTPVTPTFAPFSASGSVTKDQEKAFSFDAPAGTYAVDLSGTNDADLYVKVNGAPTTASYDCRPYTQGTNEHCDVTLTAAGKVNILVRGYASDASTFTVKGAAN